MKLKYTTDICGQDILTDENDHHQVMMEWEKPYMEKSIELFQPFGKVLEIGFGMGYSATKICEMENVTEYNVIECSPVVWKQFNEWRNNQLMKRPNLKINLIKGRWQDVLCEEGIFDCIYFDDYKGLVDLHTQTIFDEIERQYTQGKDTQFILDNIEGGVEFNSTKYFIESIKEII